MSIFSVMVILFLSAAFAKVQLVESLRRLNHLTWSYKYLYFNSRYYGNISHRIKEDLLE